MTFDELMRAWNWKPIRNCPGRYLLCDVAHDLRPEEIIGFEVEANEFNVEAAKDTVLVLKLEEGGLITYRRQDGSFLHTLNTEEGFRRKLSQLRIDSA